MRKIIALVVLVNISFSQNFWFQTYYSGYNTGIECIEARIPGVVFAGKSGTSGANALLKSTNNGLNWIILNNIGAGSFSITKQNVVYMGANGVFRSTDNGSTWIQTSFHKWVTKLVTYDSIIIVATNGSGIFRSVNNGTSWDSLSNFTIANCLEVDSIGVIYLGHYSGLFRSSNFGNSWVESGINNGHVTAIAVLYDGSVLAGVGTPIFGVLKSTNNGINWFQTGNTGTCLCFTVNGNGQIFAGTLNNGIYTSNNNGLSWSQLNSGLLQYDVYALSTTGDGYVFAGTVWSGIYRSVQSTTAIFNNKEIYPLNYTLYQNYPNPFNPTTTIKVDLPKSSKINLVICDMLGRELYIITNQYLKAGTYSFT